MAHRRFEDKVAFVTGAARGQGRNHALRLAEEGADLILLDICADVPTIGYELATKAEFDDTVADVEALGRRVVSAVADVRDGAAVRELVDRGVAELGRLDVVVSNAGIAGSVPLTELSDATWQDMIDINLTGVFQTCKATVPHLGAGGSLVLISSVAGLKGLPNNTHYTAAKHGVVGLMRSLANELAPRGIRVNCINPTNVNTRMLFNDAIYRLFLPEEEAPTREQVEPMLFGMHSLHTGWVEPDDVSNAVLFLASDEARFITGITLPIDAGVLTK